MQIERLRHQGRGGMPVFLEVGDEMDEIKPCPFCGWHDVELDEIDRQCYAVCCPDCEAIGPVSRHPDPFKGQHAAIAKWNRRVMSPDQQIEWTPADATIEHLKSH